MKVRITTLGRTSVFVDGEEVDWLATHRRRVALLLYLALEHDAPRDKVLALFWPDAPASKARNSLNQLIYNLRKALADDVITSNGDRLESGDCIDVDAHEFLAAAEAGNCAQALRVYRGSFLRDVAFPESVGLEHWAEQNRARITRLHRKARRAEIERLEAVNPALALDIAREWAELEPEDDEAQHRYLELLIRNGQRAHALRHYAAYEKLLAADELMPLDETRALMEQLRTGAAPAASTKLTVVDAPPRVRGPAPVPQPEQENDEDEVHLPQVASFIADLQRRHVLRVTTIYFFIAWGCIEIAETAFGVLGLPLWTTKVVLALSLAAAPVVVGLAWYFDITPRGFRRTR